MKRGRPFRKGTPKPANSGRKPGVVNKFTSLKESFLSAYATIGGDEGLAAWARRNRSAFYKLVAKMLPQRAEADIHFGEGFDLSDIDEESLRKIAAGDSRKEKN